LKFNCNGQVVLAVFLQP